jgi:hypothetical protein
LSLALSVPSPWIAMFCPAGQNDEPVVVRHTEGLVHGFLVLRTLEGKTLAEGDLIQTADGDRVTSKLIFHFKDGSSRSETAVFSQSHNFRLLSDHLVEKGPAFKRATEMSIDASTGEVTVRYTDENAKEKVEVERLALPGNLANGLIFTLLKNIEPDATPLTTLSLVAATPKPRLVKLEVAAQGENPFSIGGPPRQATHYVVKVDVGGVAGLVAPLIGKKPPDSHVWILGGEAPAFVKFEGPLYLDGPIWRIELTNPNWRLSARDAEQIKRSPTVLPKSGRF